MIKFLAVSLLLTASVTVKGQVDTESKEYNDLRDSVARSFNAGDSAAFSYHVARLEDYCLKHKDYHAYYTQRCNEIVFLLNRQKVFEAYKLSLKLSRELREKKLDSEYYMAINMLGHIYKYYGNNSMARQCFTEVLERMEQEGYKESMPPIYMNLVQTVIDEDPEEALALLDKAEACATTPDRKMSVDSYRTVYAFKWGNMDEFQKGYRRYKAWKAQGLTSVHDPLIDCYYLFSQGDLDGAIRATDDFEGGGETYALQKELYERAGDWKRAYEALQKEKQFDDSVNTVVLSNSMKGMQNEIDLYEAGQKLSKQRMIVLAVVIAFLSIIVVLLLIYSLTHQRYMNTMRIARDQAMESDRMKTAFISNISHEIRTPLNIIGGFMQVLSDPGMPVSVEERKQITEIVLRNTNQITSLVDELIELSLTGAGGEVEQNDSVMPNEIGRMAVAEIDREIPEEVKVGFSSDVNDEYEIKTNRNMLFKVLRALLDNAVKYTEKGHITLTFSKLDSSLRYVIEDTGCGIPPEESERIFARFEKLNDFKDGLGLGLTLARALARHLGGDVTLDTSYTDGARFILELPLP